MFDPEAFVGECVLALAEPDRAVALREVLTRAGRDRASVVSALGEPSCGGLTALHHAPDLTVLNVVWTPGMTIGPHDHTMLAAIVVYAGREENGFFRRAGARIEPAGGRTVTEGEVLLLGDDAVHSVHGHEDRYTGALHVYAGDFFDRVRSSWQPDGEPELDPPEPAEVFARAEREWQARHAAG